MIDNCAMYASEVDSNGAPPTYLFCIRCKTSYTSIIKTFVDNGGAGNDINYLDNCEALTSCSSNHIMNLNTGLGKIVNDTGLLGVNASYYLESLFSCFKCDDYKTPTFVGSILKGTGYQIVEPFGLDVTTVGTDLLTAATTLDGKVI